MAFVLAIRSTSPNDTSAIISHAVALLRGENEASNVLAAAEGEAIIDILVRHAVVPLPA